MHKLTDVAVIAPPLGRFQNQPLVMRDGNGLPAKLFSRGILEGQEGFEGQVCRHAVIDIVGPQFEA